MKNIFTIFWNAPGARPLSVALCMLLSSVMEMVSMGALVPVAGQLSSSGGGTNSFLGKIVLDAFADIGIQPSFANLLLLVGAALVAKSIIAFLAMAYVAMSVADVTTKLRSKLLGSMMNARWAYFVDYRPGEVSSMISGQSAFAGEAYYSAAQLITTSISGFGLLFTAPRYRDEMDSDGCCDDPAPAKPERLGLGTEFGEQRYSAANYTKFVRGSDRPVAIAELRYNDTAGLVALGIPVAPMPDENEIMTRETADPFPGDDRFAQPPRY